MFCSLCTLFPSALSTQHIATSGLSRESQASCFADYHWQFISQMSVLVSTRSLLVTALDRFFFFSRVLSTQENNNSCRPVSDWRHFDFCDRVQSAVLRNDHFSRFQAGLPCLYLKFWKHWLRYHLFLIRFPGVVLLPIIFWRLTFFDGLDG